MFTDSDSDLNPYHHASEEEDGDPIALEPFPRSDRPHYTITIRRKTIQAKISSMNGKNLFPDYPEFKFDEEEEQPQKGISWNKLSRGVISPFSKIGEKIEEYQDAERKKNNKPDSVTFMEPALEVKRTKSQQEATSASPIEKLVSDLLENPQVKREIVPALEYILQTHDSPQKKIVFKKRLSKSLVLDYQSQNWEAEKMYYSVEDQNLQDYSIGDVMRRKSWAYCGPVGKGDTMLQNICSTVISAEAQRRAQTRAQLAKARASRKSGNVHLKSSSNTPDEGSDVIKRSRKSTIGEARSSPGIRYSQDGRLCIVSDESEEPIIRSLVKKKSTHEQDNPTVMADALLANHPKTRRAQAEARYIENQMKNRKTLKLSPHHSLAGSHSSRSLHPDQRRRHTKTTNSDSVPNRLSVTQSRSAQKFPNVTSRFRNKSKVSEKDMTSPDTGRNPGTRPSKKPGNSVTFETPSREFGMPKKKGLVLKRDDHHYLNPGNVPEKHTHSLNSSSLATSSARKKAAISYSSSAVTLTSISGTKRKAKKSGGSPVVVVGGGTGDKYSRPQLSSTATLGSSGGAKKHDRAIAQILAEIVSHKDATEEDLLAELDKIDSGKKSAQFYQQLEESLKQQKIQLTLPKIEPNKKRLRDIYKSDYKVNRGLVKPLSCRDNKYRQDTISNTSMSTYRDGEGIGMTKSLLPYLKKEKILKYR